MASGTSKFVQEGGSSTTPRRHDVLVGAVVVEPTSSRLTEPRSGRPVGISSRATSSASTRRSAAAAPSPRALTYWDAAANATKNAAAGTGNKLIGKAVKATTVDADIPSFAFACVVTPKEPQASRRGVPRCSSVTQHLSRPVLYHVGTNEKESQATISKTGSSRPMTRGSSTEWSWGPVRTEDLDLGGPDPPRAGDQVHWTVGLGMFV